MGILPTDVDGIYCCNSQCSQCGGSGCGSAGDGCGFDNFWNCGKVNCCSKDIIDSERTCEGPLDTYCIIEGPNNKPYNSAYGLVQNNDFELGKTAWSRYTSGGRNGYTVDTLHKNSGSQSIKVTNGGASQWIPLDAPARSTITISGYSKAVGTSTGLPRVEASVYYGEKTPPVFNYLSNIFVKCSYLMLVQTSQQFILHYS